MEPYAKPPLTYARQVSRCKERGLTVDSNEKAVKFLQQVNYYRFSAYCIPFQNPRDVFIPGSTFETIVKLYRLDEELRNAFLEVLSPIEVFLRTRIAYELSHGWGAFAQGDPGIFRNDFDHPKWLLSLDEEAGRAKETFIKHYKSKYIGFPRLPLWMACEVMSLGSLSLLYTGLLPDPQRRICSIFEVHHEVLRNWMHVITYLRNVCAHHSRLWNREFAIRLQIPHKSTEWAILGLDNRYVYSIAVVMEWICRKTGLSESKVEQVYATMRAISGIDRRFAKLMGVPAGRSIGRCWEGED